MLVRYRRCSTVFLVKKLCSYTGYKFRTSNLLKNKCESGLRNTSVSSKLQQRIKNHNFLLNLKLLGTKQQVKSVTKNIISFLVEMAHFLVSVGARHGTVSAKELMPRTTYLGI
jgi:hypothetical protein